jgi:hypothetical protein
VGLGWLCQAQSLLLGCLNIFIGGYSQTESSLFIAPIAPLTVHAEISSDESLDLVTLTEPSKPGCDKADAPIQGIIPPKLLVLNKAVITSRDLHRQAHLCICLVVLAIPHEDTEIESIAELHTITVNSQRHSIVR